MTGRISLLLFIVLFACSPGSGGAGSGTDGGALPDARADGATEDQGSEDGTTEDAAGGTIIGPEGGVVTGPGGALVEVPEGALEEDLEIAIAEAAEGPDDFIGLGPVFAFTPHGAQFLLPVAVTLPYDSDIMPGAEVRVYWADAPEGDWEPLDSIANPAEGRVRAEVTHFSFGGAGASAVSCAGGPHVDDLGDGGDQTVADGVCEAEGGGCTLRAAIQQANGCKGAQTITFADFGEEAIVPKRSMSPIAGPTVLQGSDVYGERPVWIYGASAGAGSDTHGLTITSDEVVIRGLRVTDFYGDGIHADIAADAVLTLHDVDISDNCGWGIRSGGIVDLGMDGATPIPDQASEIRNNGTFMVDCVGGGILAWRSNARIGGTELRHNGATGILAQGDVQVALVVVSQNNGDGIRSHGGRILVSNVPGNPDKVDVAYNQGNGIVAGGAIDPDEGSEDPWESSDGVHIEHRTDIVSNAGWGVLSRGSTVIGRVEGGAMLPTPGSITDNGKGLTCRIPAEDDELSEDPPMIDPECGGGGLMNPSGATTTVEATWVGGNAGIGILSLGDVEVGAISVTGNQGDGIRTQAGTISWHSGTLSEDNQQVQDNRGFGMRAGQSTDDDDESNAVTIEAPIDVNMNGRWGIYADGGVSMGNLSGISIPESSQVSSNGNGFGDPCFRWTIDEPGDLEAVVEEVSCGGGGVVATGGPAFIVNTDVDHNDGPGVLANQDVTLRGVHVFDSRGPGVQSAGGGVMVQPSGEWSNTFAGNAGSGIVAAGTCDGDDCYGVRLQSEVDVSGNASIGVVSGSRGIEIGLYAGEPVMERSEVSNNGGGEGCVAWSLTGGGMESSPIEEPSECQGGGIWASGEGGSVVASRLDVIGNTGHGIEADAAVDLQDSEVSESTGTGIVAGGSLAMTGGTLCDNGEAEYDVEGEVDLQGVTICSHLDELCDDTHPCVQGLACEYNPVDGKSSCLELCISYGDLCYAEVDESDACCWGVPCTGASPIYCNTWSEGLPCTLGKQCYSGHCEGGVCVRQTEGEACQHDANCDYGLVCHQGSCQACDGTADWCSDECCPGMECGDNQKCCKPAGWACTQDGQCCSGDCDLYGCGE